MSIELELLPRIHTHGRSRENITGDQRTVLPIYDYDNKSSPCRESCPAGHDIAQALHFMQEGEFASAHALFLEESPYPSITGRVCYHPCETGCNRKDYDSPIAINALERALAEYGDVPAEAATLQYAGEPIAVVGSGPAGATVAYHLARLGYPVTVFERDALLGGALRYGIPRYRLPADIIDTAFQRLRTLGVTFSTGVSVGTDISWDELEQKYAAVFLGIGKPRGRSLAVDGIGESGAWSGLDFLRAVNEESLTELKGDVAIIGGGDVAIDCVRSAIRLGADAVYAYCLESRTAMPAHPDEVAEALAEGLYLHDELSVTGVERVENGRLRLSLRDVVEFQPSHPPVLGTHSGNVNVDHLISAIGQESDADWLPDDVMGNGRIGVDAIGRTGRARVFSGGDIAGTYNVVQAIGAGKRAAIGIDCALRGWEPAIYVKRVSVGAKGVVSMRDYVKVRGTLRGNPPSNMTDIVLIDRINLDYFPERPRVRLPELPIRDRRGFVEVNGTLTKQEAIREAHRCFNCSECTVCGNCFIYCPDSAVLQREDGFFTIDSDHCKGCGVCVQECPRSAMSMVVERGQ
jgi:2-oxoacid:acceptor oxidoreductase delta subunit (pyruvate/2-ketoisovalerate family)